MFYVKDGSAAQRRKIVEDHASMNMAVGLILATIDFEWTFRRVVKVLSPKGLSDLKPCLANSFGLDKYKKLWNEEVKHGAKSIPSLVEMFHKAGVAWTGPKETSPGIREAFHERDKMVHGCRCKAGDGYLRKRIDVLLAAVDALENFARSQGYDIYTDVIKKSQKKTRGKLS